MSRISEGGNKMWRVGDEELSYIKREVLEEGLSGRSNLELEERFCKKFGVGYAIGISSATAGLHCCVHAAKIQPGDEVITTPLTFAATVTSIMYGGGVPIFVDIDPETFNIDPNKIEGAITPRTKAIMPVSMYGLPCDIDPIMEIARKYNLKVIEDNAECFLGKYRGRIVGTTADMSIFSFERSKHLTTGQGGIIVTNDEELARTARRFGNLGYITLDAKLGSLTVPPKEIRRPEFKRHHTLGFNYPFPEVCAAMALAQLDKADMLIERRKEIGRAYEEAVQGCDWITPQKTPAGFENTYWTYAFRVDTSRVDWRDFQRIFHEEGGDDFYAAFSLTYLEPFLEGRSLNGIKYEKGLCPVAEEIQPQLVQLKTNYGTKKKIQEQAEALRRTIKRIDEKS